MVERERKRREDRANEEGDGALAKRIANSVQQSICLVSVSLGSAVAKHKRMFGYNFDYVLGATVSLKTVLAQDHFYSDF